MSDKIEPALSAEGWAYFREEVERRKAINGPDGAPLDTIPLSSLRFDGTTSASAIAKANALLPDCDPHKITREWVHAIRNAAPAMPARRDATEWTTRLQAEATAEAHRAVLDMIADALSSYLPPEPT